MSRSSTFLNKIYQFINIHQFLSYIYTEVGKTHVLELAPEEYIEIFYFSRNPLQANDPDDNEEDLRPNNNGIGKLC